MGNGQKCFIPHPMIYINNKERVICIIDSVFLLFCVSAGEAFSLCRVVPTLCSGLLSFATHSLFSTHGRLSQD